MPKPIGGYLPWEFSRINETIARPNAYPMNLGRAALEMIIRARKYRKIYLPAYNCPVVFELLEKVGVEYEFYSIDKRLEPIFDKEIGDDEGFVYVDYFGVKDGASCELAKTMKNYIVDATQAFFFEPPKGVDAYNSVRKFIGAPDGGYAFGDFVEGLELPRQEIASKCLHLLARADGHTEEGYKVFVENDDEKGNWEPKQISRLSEQILLSVSLEDVAKKRRDLFNRLYDNLQTRNELDLSYVDRVASTFAPLCYPFLVPNGAELKKRLIAEKIFVPTYWGGLVGLAEDSFEKRLLDDLVCLPVDQNCTFDDVAEMINILSAQ